MRLLLRRDVGRRHSAICLISARWHLLRTRSREPRLFLFSFFFFLGVMLSEFALLHCDGEINQEKLLRSEGK